MDRASEGLANERDDMELSTLTEGDVTPEQGLVNLKATGDKLNALMAEFAVEMVAATKAGVPIGEVVAVLEQVMSGDDDSPLVTMLAGLRP